MHCAGYNRVFPGRNTDKMFKTPNRTRLHRAKRSLFSTAPAIQFRPGRRVQLRHPPSLKVNVVNAKRATKRVALNSSSARAATRQPATYNATSRLSGGSSQNSLNVDYGGRWCSGGVVVAPSAEASPPDSRRSTGDDPAWCFQHRGGSIPPSRLASRRDAEGETAAAAAACQMD